MSTADRTLLDRLEHYFDEVPRAFADTEEIGPFTLFLRRSESSWPYYARPRLGGPAATFTVDEVQAVRSRQRALHVPEALEWVAATTPGLAEVARDAGLVVAENPLLVLPEDARVRDPASWLPDGVRLAVLSGGSEELPAVVAAVGAGFGGTDTLDHHDTPADLPDRLSRGLLRMVGAFDGDGPVGGGSHSPRSGVTELTGIAVLPRARRAGVGAALTAALVQDARTSGTGTVFLSASSDEVAAVYERVGFVRVGTACVAEAPS